MTGVTGPAPPCGLPASGRLPWAGCPGGGEEKPREQAEVRKASGAYTQNWCYVTSPLS